MVINHSEIGVMFTNLAILGARIVLRVLLTIMWLKQCHKPSMAGNGKHTTHKLMVIIWGLFMALF